MTRATCSRAMSVQYELDCNSDWRPLYGTGQPLWIRRAADERIEAATGNLVRAKRRHATKCW